MLSLGPHRLVYLAALLASAIAVASAWPHTGKIQNLVAFGDSYTGRAPFTRWCE